MTKQQPAHAGFTLIEVVLAIALSAVLLSLMTLAVTQYLTNVQSSRSAVEHAQVARGVLRLIADDLRNTAVRYKQDTAAAEERASQASSFDVDSVDDEAGDGSESAADAFSDAAGGGAVDETEPMGVSGETDWLQVDVNRSRRRSPALPDEFAAEADAIETPPIGGASTVRYSIAPEGGLLRQEVNRRLALWEEQQGVTESWDAARQVIAPEVTAIAFRYRDGANTLERWDLTETDGALPQVVEVQVSLVERRATDDAPAISRTYRMTVALPAIDPGDAATPDGLPSDESNL